MSCHSPGRIADSKLSWDHSARGVMLGQAGLLQRQACKKKKKPKQPLFLLSLFPKETHNMSPCSAGAPNGLGHGCASVSSRQSFPTLSSSILIAPRRDKSQHGQSEKQLTVCHLLCPAGLPGEQSLVTMRRATAQPLVKICYPHAWNKIKLKALLCCQDKGPSWGDNFSLSNTQLPAEAASDTIKNK